MPTWNIAAVQMNCVQGDRASNLAKIRSLLKQAAAAGAKLIAFPEAILTGYCFDGIEEARRHAEPIPGPSTLALAEDCRGLGVFAVVGMIEECPEDRSLFNAAALIGPDGVVGVYRKVHLPFLGMDRFMTPGDRPFAVHDLGGLRVGISICYDGSFPEAARCLMLGGADLIVLPTNWPAGARGTARILPPARALENNVYYAAVNRVGTEGGFDFIGMSQILDCVGNYLAKSDDDRETILYATIDPEAARKKRIVHAAGKYELDRIAHRRPDAYSPLTEPVAEKRR